MQRELTRMEIVEESRLQAVILEGNRAVTMAHSETAVYVLVYNCVMVL